MRRMRGPPTGAKAARSYRLVGASTGALVTRRIGSTSRLLVSIGRALRLPAAQSYQPLGADGFEVSRRGYRLSRRVPACERDHIASHAHALVVLAGAEARSAGHGFSRYFFCALAARRGASSLGSSSHGRRLRRVLRILGAGLSGSSPDLRLGGGALSSSSSTRLPLPCPTSHRRHLGDWRRRVVMLALSWPTASGLRSDDPSPSCSVGSPRASSSRPALRGYLSGNFDALLRPSSDDRILSCSRSPCWA